MSNFNRPAGGSLFSNPSGNTATGSLFSGKIDNTTTTSPSLFGNITGSNGIFTQPGGNNTSLFSQPSGGNTGGLFGQPTGNQSLFSQPSGNLMSQPTNNSGSLFAQPSGNTGGLFNQPSSNPGLFSQTSTNNTSLFSQPSSNTGGLFNQPSSGTGGLFNQPSSNTGGLFNQPSSNTGGLFNQPSSNTGGLFNQPSSNTGGLFNQPSSNTGGLFNQPSSNTGGLFNQPSSNTGGLFNQPSGGLFSQNNQGGLFSNSTQHTPIAYTSQSSALCKIIGTLSDQEKNAFVNLKLCLNQHDNNLTESETILKAITKTKSEIKEKMMELFIFTRKVQTAEKRCKVTVEGLKKFENNISRFIKDAIAVYNQCEFADSYHQIDSPGIFLSEMLGSCDERLKCIEDNFKEIQELFSVESESSQILMLINTISLMQEKFQLISSIAYDMHKKVAEVVWKYQDNLEIRNALESKGKDIKIKKNENTKKYSSIKDIISGKSSYSGYY